MSDYDEFEEVTLACNLISVLFLPNTVLQLKMKFITLLYFYLLVLWTL